MKPSMTLRGVAALTVSLEEGVLELELVDDDCAFGDVRVRYLTAGPWTRGTEGT